MFENIRKTRDHAGRSSLRIICPPPPPPKPPSASCGPEAKSVARREAYRSLQANE